MSAGAWAIAQRWALALALGALVLDPPSASADTGAQVGGRYYTVETPQAHWNAGSGDFTAAGMVRLTRPGLVAYADHAIGNTKSGNATLTGHVRVEDDGTSGGAIAGGAKEPSTLTCDELEVSGKLDTYRATGRAHYASADRTASAETMILDRKHHQLYLAGDVALEQQGSTLAGDRVYVDLRSGQTDETGSPLVITSPVSPSPRSSPAASPAPAPLPSPVPSRAP
jgi:lipopolysaccharide assembly outer membrane protein LptD (OstA)